MSAKISDNVNSCSNNIIINLNTAMHSSMNNEPYPDISNLMSIKKMFNVLDSNMIIFDTVNQFGVLYNNGDMYVKNKSSWETSLETMN